MNHNRTRRRILAADERRARRTGKWTPWERVPDDEIAAVRSRLGGICGWATEAHTVFRNGWLVVMIRDCPNEWGTVQHAIIRTAELADLSWAEKQRIKNEIFGTERIALEVFPAEERLVDAADIYHLWVLPEGMQLPFGLHERDRERAA